jgi:serine/threonine protein kinase/CheY-like chemotaxis protein
MSGGTVLVVDDNAVNRMLLTGILEQAGYVVRAAACGTEALQLATENPPELVLLDIQMPGMSGYEVCRTMHARPRLAGIPVVFISALDDVDEKVKAFEAGGVDYVTKPFETAEVLARVSSQIRLFRLNRQLRDRNLDLQRKNEQLAIAHQRTERVFVALSESLTGTVLDETYRLDEKIGEGGFGAVFRSVHLRTRKPVAVKVLRPTMTGSGELERFRREGIAACRIAHPNAVEVFDFAVSSTGVPYLVMELLRGRTLGAVLRDTGILTPARCASVIAPVCEALAAAHAAGIVHRDVKPDNVFLHESETGEVVKVVDFGIARLLDLEVDGGAPADSYYGPTETGTFIGTPCYTAPERLLGGSYDERADIYSVGLLLYLCLAGYLPFEGAGTASVPDMVRMHLTGAPRPLTIDPPELAALIMRMLEKEPVGRPPLVTVAWELRRLTAPEPPHPPAVQAY